MSSTMVMTKSGGRLAALGRAEMRLLLRSKAALLSVLFLPGILTFSMHSMVAEQDLAGTGLSVGTVLLPGALGMSLLFGVYANLTGVYVVRREELVLKRLRTGECPDAEILGAAALPAALLTLVQCALLGIGTTVALDIPAPVAPHLVLVALPLGLVMLAAFAALTAAFTRTAESAQLTFMPLMMLSLLGSGLFAPRELMPEALADVAARLPYSPVMDLLRGGWTGDLSGFDQLRLIAFTVCWTGVAVWGVRRWFRWEPRR